MHKKKIIQELCRSEEGVMSEEAVLPMTSFYKEEWAKKIYRVKREQHNGSTTKRAAARSVLQKGCSLSFTAEMVSPCTKLPRCSRYKIA